jgi:hypothetical protein
MKWSLPPIQLSTSNAISEASHENTNPPGRKVNPLFDKVTKFFELTPNPTEIRQHPRFYQF